MTTGTQRPAARGRGAGRRPARDGGRDAERAPRGHRRRARAQPGAAARGLGGAHDRVPRRGRPHRRRAARAHAPRAAEQAAEYGVVLDHLYSAVQHLQSHDLVNQLIDAQKLRVDKMREKLGEALSLADPARRRPGSAPTSGSSARARCSTASSPASSRSTRTRARPPQRQEARGQRRPFLERGTTMKTILAVDDSATMREMVAFVLESAGYRVIEAEDGAQGLDRATATSVRPGHHRPEHAQHGRPHAGAQPARAARLQERADPAAHHRILGRDEGAGPRRGRHRLAGEAVRSRHAARGGAEGAALGRRHGHRPEPVHRHLLRRGPGAPGVHRGDGDGARLRPARTRRR